MRTTPLREALEAISADRSGGELRRGAPSSELLRIASALKQPFSLDPKRFSTRRVTFDPHRLARSNVLSGTSPPRDHRWQNLPMRLHNIATASFLFLTALAQGQVSTDPQPRNALLEEFTAINCGNCPAGHATAAIIAAANPGRVVMLNVHAGSLAVPGSSQPDLRTPWGNQLHSAFGVSFTPQGLVSRRAHNGVVLLGPSAWSAAVNALMPQTAIVNLAIGTEYDPGTRELSLEVEHYCTSSSPGSPDRLHVLLTEDHITAYQANYGPGGAQAAYDHRHALRAALTPFEGHALGSGAQGETGAATFGYTLPESWNAANVRVVAFIAEENGEVHQVAEAMATGSTTMIPDQQRPMLIVMAPNPANESVTLLLSECSTGVFSVRDASGRLVHAMNVAAGQRAARLSVEGWSEGVYIVTDERGHAARLLIQH